METIDFDSSPVITLKKDHHGIFSEKYRPTNLKEFIGNLELKEKINEYIEKNDIPHLLFYGPPGSGKTSASKLIANSIRCDSLYINASDEHGLDDVRNKIKSFAENSGFISPSNKFLLTSKITNQKDYSLYNMKEDKENKII